MDVIEKPDDSWIRFKEHQQNKKPNQESFTLSLIKEGLRTRRISQAEAESFQLGIMDLLKDLILRYTKGESTSVTVDTAENILCSLFYSLDAGLQSLNDTEAALNTIKSGNARQVYDRGLALVTARFTESKALYLNLRKSRLKVGLEAYDLTINEGLEIFFHTYGPVFDAHRGMASIDYPLLFDDTSITGVNYIKNYVETFCMENRFCSLFPNEAIREVLGAYGRIHKIEYAKTLTNIFELVFNAAFFAALSGQSKITLGMTGEKYRILAGKLDELSSLEMDALIDAGIKKVLHDLGVIEKVLLDYIAKYQGMLKTRLASALATNTLKNFVLLEDEPFFQGHATIFLDGERMSDANFKNLTQRLTGEQDALVKSGMIRSEVHSFEDLIDILGSGCFFGEEYLTLFLQLNDQELALLAKVLFSDEMRDGPINLSKAITLGIATGVEWQERFTEYLLGLKRERLQLMETYMNNTFIQGL